MSTNARKEANLYATLSNFITDISRAKCQLWPLQRFGINHKEFFVLLSWLRTNQRRSSNQPPPDWPSCGGNDKLYLTYRKITDQGQTREMETSGCGPMMTVIMQEHWRETSKINGMSMIDSTFFLVIMNAKKSSGIHHKQQLITFDVWYTFLA